LDEVYVYGSFVQSKMYRAGVRCSDCHDPHSLELKAPGNAVCSGCHLPSAYDTPEHHHHVESSTGAQCVECHMPATTYMVVDPRRDHSMRIPSPQLTEELGVPNACNGCHVDEPVSWSIAAVEQWYDSEREVPPHFAQALEAGRNGEPGAGDLLSELAADSAESGIVRATALGLPGRDVSFETFEAIQASALDPDPMVRLGALSALEAVPPDGRLQVAFRMLRDPVRAVRIEAA
jgi:hypothetical protein